jgi:hypothetical protein
MKTLFLDFDGVLHPFHVYMSPDGTEPFLKMPPGHQYPDAALFMWTPILERIVAEATVEVQIVLSTTWGLRLGLEKAASYLPESLRRLVVDRTWSDPTIQWRYLNGGISRAEQISLYLSENPKIKRWVAVDDDPILDLSHKRMLSRWIQTDYDLGLSDQAVQQKLRKALKS